MAHDRDRPSHPGYANFELEVGRGKGRVYPVEIRSPAGDLQVTMRFLTPKALKTHLLQLENALLRSSGAHRLVLGPEQQAVQAFGRDLFDAVLPEEARGLYYQSLREAEHQGQGLRFKLRIESPELAALPWEFLFDSRNHQYVGLSVDTPIVRDLGLPQPIEPLRVDPPIRILGMIASPSGTAPLDVKHEQQRMDEALRQLQDQGTVTLDWLPGQTWRELQQALRRGTYHVFHFVGHGGFDPRKDEGLVLLADEQGAPHRLPATELAMLLHDAKALRLAVLNSCDTALGGGTDLFASTASILVRQGEIPAVLAMQFAISDPAAIEFSRTFYEAIAEGLPVDAAVAEARKAVRLAIPDTLEWATPVLHQRSPDGILFDLQRPDSPPPPTPVEQITAPPNGSAGLIGQDHADDAGGPPVAKESRPTPRSLWARMPDVAKAITGLTGLVTAIGGLLTALVATGVIGGTGPTPIPSAPQTAQQVTLGGRLFDAQIEDGVTLGEGCRERQWPCQKFSEDQYPAEGKLINFQAELKGYTNRECEVRWTLYDAQTEQPVPNFQNQPAWPKAVFTPEGPVDTARGEVWVPLPMREGEFFVRLMLFNDIGAELGRLDTGSFSGMP
jgi:hypothetical protein